MQDQATRTDIAAYAAHIEHAAASAHLAARWATEATDGRRAHGWAAIAHDAAAAAQEHGATIMERAPGTEDADDAADAAQAAHEASDAASAAAMDMQPDADAEAAHERAIEEATEEAHRAAANAHRRAAGMAPV